MLQSNFFNYIAITNNPKHAKILDYCGVNQIMIDAESIGKSIRQPGNTTVINSHQIKDILLLKNENLHAEIICRINGFHSGSKNEIDLAIEYGTDSIMIPMILNIDNYFEMVSYVNNRCKIIPLIETPYSLFKLDDILTNQMINQIHFGLNDLHISLGMKNLFEVMQSNIFKHIFLYTQSFKNIKISGFGGIGNPLNNQKIDPILILKKHLNLKSNSVILSRNFFEMGYNSSQIIKALEIFNNEIDKYKNIFNNFDLNKQIEKL
jgi:hypothetical protein